MNKFITVLACLAVSCTANAEQKPNPLAGVPVSVEGHTPDQSFAIIAHDGTPLFNVNNKGELVGVPDYDRICREFDSIQAPMDHVLIHAIIAAAGKRCMTMAQDMDGARIPHTVTITHLDPDPYSQQGFHSQTCDTWGETSDPTCSTVDVGKVK